MENSSKASSPKTCCFRRDGCRSAKPVEPFFTKNLHRLNQLSRQKAFLHCDVKPAQHLLATTTNRSSPISSKPGCRTTKNTANGHAVLHRASEQADLKLDAGCAFGTFYAAGAIVCTDMLTGQTHRTAINRLPVANSTSACVPFPDDLSRSRGRIDGRAPSGID